MSLKQKFEAALSRPGEIARESSVITPSRRYEGRVGAYDFSPKRSRQELGSVALLEKPADLDAPTRQIDVTGKSQTDPVEVRHIPSSSPENN